MNVQVFQVENKKRRNIDIIPDSSIFQLPIAQVAPQVQPLMATSSFITVTPIFTVTSSRVRTARRPRRIALSVHPRACMKAPENQTVLDMPVGNYNDEEKPLLGVDQKKTPGFVDNTEPLDARVLFSEFMCTFLFCYLSVTAAAPVTAGAPPPPQALTNGAVIAAIVSFMPDAHLNPAVTAALLVTRRISPVRALAFVPLQLIAAAAATYLVSGLGIPVIFGGADTTNIVKALADEILPMAFIVFVVFQQAVATKEKNGVIAPAAALYIGLSVLACAGTFTTGVFNPARSFGPALVTGNFTAHWVFWVGPFIGAIVAALMAEHVFLAPAAGRPPKSWLHIAGKRMDSLKSSILALGLAGIIAYGLLNCIFYSTVMSVVLLKSVDYSVTGIVKAFLIAWGLSTATKPIRLAITFALAPLIDRRVVAIWRARNQTNSR